MDWINHNLDITRFIASFIGGVFLTMAGSLTQLVGGNSLASPSTLGMNAFAVLFVIISYFIPNIAAEIGGVEWTSLILFHFGLFLLLIFSKHYKKVGAFEIWQSESFSKILILGLAFNLFVGALFSIIQFLFMAYNLDFPTGLWFGSFKQVRVEFLFFLLPVFFISLFLVRKIGPKISLLNFGRDFVYGLKIDVENLQKKVFFFALYLSGIVISFFGVFSFLGLVFPHLLRQFPAFRNDMYKELVIGPFICGLFLAVLDQITFVFLIQGAEVPVGMLSGILGTLFLMFQLLKSRGSSFLNFAK